MAEREGLFAASGGSPLKGAARGLRPLRVPSPSSATLRVSSAGPESNRGVLTWLPPPPGSWRFARVIRGAWIRPPVLNHEGRADEF